MNSSPETAPAARPIPAQHVAELAHLPEADRQLDRPRLEPGEPHEDPRQPTFATTTSATSSAICGSAAGRCRDRSASPRRRRTARRTRRGTAAADGGPRPSRAVADREAGDERGERQWHPEEHARRPPAIARPEATDTIRNRSCSERSRSRTNGSTCAATTASSAERDEAEIATGNGRPPCPRRRHDRPEGDAGHVLEHAPAEQRLLGRLVGRAPPRARDVDDDDRARHRDGQPDQRGPERRHAERDRTPAATAVVMSRSGAATPTAARRAHAGVGRGRPRSRPRTAGTRRRARPAARSGGDRPRSRA